MTSSIVFSNAGPLTERYKCYREAYSPSSPNSQVLNAQFLSRVGDLLSDPNDLRDAQYLVPIVWQINFVQNTLPIWSISFHNPTAKPPGTVKVNLH